MNIFKIIFFDIANNYHNNGFERMKIKHLYSTLNGLVSHPLKSRPGKVNLNFIELFYPN